MPIPNTRICFRFFKPPDHGPARPSIPLFRISFSGILVASWLFPRRILEKRHKKPI